MSARLGPCIRVSPSAPTRRSMNPNDCSRSLPSSTARLAKRLVVLLPPGHAASVVLGTVRATGPDKPHGRIPRVEISTKPAVSADAAALSRLRFVMFEAIQVRSAGRGMIVFPDRNPPTRPPWQT